MQTLHSVLCASLLETQPRSRERAEDIRLKCALSPQSGGKGIILAKRQCNENLTQRRGKRWCFTVVVPTECNLPNRKTKLGAGVCSYKWLVH